MENDELIIDITDEEPEKIDYKPVTKSDKDSFSTQILLQFQMDWADWAVVYEVKLLYVAACFHLKDQLVKLPESQFKEALSELNEAAILIYEFHSPFTVSPDLFDSFYDSLKFLNLKQVLDLYEFMKQQVLEKHPKQKNSFENVLLKAADFSSLTVQSCYLRPIQNGYLGLCDFIFENIDLFEEEAIQKSLRLYKQKIYSLPERLKELFKQLLALSVERSMYYPEPPEKLVLTASLKGMQLYLSKDGYRKFLKAYFKICQYPSMDEKIKRQSPILMDHDFEHLYGKAEPKDQARRLFFAQLEAQNQKSYNQKASRFITDVPLRIALALSGLYSENSIFFKEARDSIDPSHINEFDQLAFDKPAFSLPLYQKAKMLLVPVVKKVELDSTALEKSKKDLALTIEKVTDFENVPEEKVKKPVQKENKPKPANQMDALLHELLEKGSLSLSKFEENYCEGQLPFMKLSVFNASAVDQYGEPILLEEEEQIKIDPFFIDEVKEKLKEESV